MIQADVPKRSSDYRITLPKGLQSTNSYNKLYIYIYSSGSLCDWLYPVLTTMKTDSDSREMLLTSLAKEWSQSRNNTVYSQDFPQNCLSWAFVPVLCQWLFHLGWECWFHCVFNLRIIYQITLRFLWILFLLGKTPLHHLDASQFWCYSYGKLLLTPHYLQYVWERTSHNLPGSLAKNVRHYSGNHQLPVGWLNSEFIIVLLLQPSVWFH